LSKTKGKKKGVLRVENIKEGRKSGEQVPRKRRELGTPRPPGWQRQSFRVSKKKVSRQKKVKSRRKRKDLRPFKKKKI